MAHNMGLTEQPRPDWAPLPRPGCKNVEFRVLLSGERITIANLRFGEYATIDEHDAAWEIDVVCLSGSGFTRIDGIEHAIRAGQTVSWPKNIQHCLWTDGSAMETLMVERHRS